MIFQQLPVELQTTLSLLCVYIMTNTFIKTNPEPRQPCCFEVPGEFES